MNILVIGSGGREHALVWKLAQSKRVKKIFCAPGNPGIGEWATTVPIAATDIVGLVSFAKENHIDLTMVGPEAPLILGIVDAFQKEKLRIVGPNGKAAQIEGSKVFAKNILKKYHIPTASFSVFTSAEEALDHLKKQSFPLVVKADGPALGKGVSVCQTKQEAEQFIRELMEDMVFGSSGSRIIVEDFLVGPEVSFMVATDGTDFVSFLPSQDHKRVFDGNLGAMTGGMGAYAPAAFVDAAMVRRIESEIVAPTLAAMKKEGCPYRGILYPGLIITKNGPKVLEFNCRLGDPETQALMMLLETDLIEILEAIESLKVAPLKKRMKWKPGAAACVVLTSKGYPGSYEKGTVINGLERINMSSSRKTSTASSVEPRGSNQLSGSRVRPGMTNNRVVVFHSGTKEKNGQFVTDGGRVLGVTAYGADLTQALAVAYQSIGPAGIHFSGMQYRKDIGCGSKGPDTIV